MTEEREVSDGNTLEYLHDDEVVEQSADFPLNEKNVEDPPAEAPGFIQTKLDFTELERVQKEQGLVTEDVMNHLLFHKALIGEEEHYERINRYIEIVTSLEKCVHLSMGNIYEQSIAITFELVIEHRLDPWDVDLVRFSTRYLKRAKEEGIDLASAGRIILMAWTILKLQSKDLLRKAEMPFEEPEEDYYGDNFEFQNEQDLDFTQRVMYNDEPPIKEMIWRHGKRPVTLIELVDAFNEARKAAELQQIISVKREELRAKNLKQRKENVDKRMHKDHLEEDMKIVWERIAKFNGHPIPFTDIWEGDKTDWIVTLRSLLFLAERSWIKVWQRKFPYGEIMIRNIAEPGEMPKMQVKAVQEQQTSMDTYDPKATPNS
jgi:segregation and condensation protein A